MLKTINGTKLDIIRELCQGEYICEVITKYGNYICHIKGKDIVGKENE